MLALLAGFAICGGGPVQAQQRGVPVEFTGEFEIVHIDNTDGPSENRYFVRDERARSSFELLFEGPAPKHLRPGRIVTVRGEAHGNRILVADLAAGGESAGEPAVYPAVSVNERNAVVLLVDLADSAVAASPATAASHMFTGANSVAMAYQDSSYGQVSLPVDTDGDGQPDVFGPFAVAGSSSSCDYYGWAYGADEAAEAAGIDLSLYQHRVYVLPRACGWGGVANLGCGSVCRAWIFSSTNGPIYAHEFGHNLRLHHAATDPENDGNINSEYGDYSDPLGSSSGGWRGHNAAHKEQMNWFDAFPGSVITVGSSGVYDIFPLSLDPGTADGPQVLAIPKSDTGEVYYVSYRQQDGADAVGLPVEHRIGIAAARHAGGYGLRSPQYWAWGIVGFPDRRDGL